MKELSIIRKIKPAHVVALLCAILFGPFTVLAIAVIAMLAGMAMIIRSIAKPEDSGWKMLFLGVLVCLLSMVILFIHGFFFGA